MRTCSRRLGRLVRATAIACALVPSQQAGAAFPGPDGRIAFVQDSNVYTMQPDGGGMRRLTSLPAGSAAHFASWSPNGRRLVFDVAPPGGSAQLWLMHANGSGQRLLLDDPGYDDLDASFSPNGASVIFSRCQTTCQIYRIGTDGSGLTALTPFDPAVLDFQSPYSPDGTTIAFGRFSSDFTAGGIDLMNADGSNVRRLTPLELGAADPDGPRTARRLCSRPTAATRSTPSCGRSAPTARSRPGSPRASTCMTSSRHGHPPATRSPSSGTPPSAARSGIYVMPPDGSHVKMIERGGAAPRWGPAP